ncbi:hypothetical protein PTSG_00768 [Salpingoeca rosetta]|uniref:polynucleotide adenylyltransferase n=1 Tax=Salpingoeca rosetta (strain ATCC 50818 / BSB-021) TaxID=946362 RepID=F2TXF0_SALR5|nr:uncharacterized protein PTSG_00768 [Salpingoeca rosetta]EGD76059.1 hypothetical protein PTSG_00768 [Salpingoeca rosetta]|eukprot:XP_004998234.1 hypothetical protein PTSG_00768 [Salpingoeca rosetta]
MMLNDFVPLTVDADEGGAEPSTKRSKGKGSPKQRHGKHDKDDRKRKKHRNARQGEGQHQDRRHKKRDAKHKDQQGDDEDDPYPWCTRKYSKIPSIALHQEIVDFHKYMEPMKEEVTLRRAFVDRVKEVILGLWPKAEVTVFGSFNTGLYLPTSDIDVVVFGDWAVPPLQTLARALRQVNIPDKMEVIAKARVPIVKFRDKVTNLWMDISFNQPSGPQDSINVKKWKTQYRGLVPLVLIIKQFLLQRGLNEPFSGGIGSYAVFLLVMSFLQRRPLTSPTPNFGVLLIEFFELYGLHFNFYDVGISVRGTGKYFPKTGRWSGRRQREIMSIENPRDPSHDVTGNAFATPMIREAFQHAYFVLTSNMHEKRPKKYQRPQSLLGQIVQVDQDTTTYRQWVKQFVVDEHGPVNDETATVEEAEEEIMVLE